MAVGRLVLGQTQRHDLAESLLRSRKTRAQFLHFVCPDKPDVAVEELQAVIVADDHYRTACVKASIGMDQSSLRQDLLG